MKGHKVRMVLLGVALVLVVPMLVAMVNGQGDSSVAATVGRDVQQYADDYGVSVDVAQSRLDMQDEIGGLDATLLSSESSTFGGLWVEHSPAYKVKVGFTEDGAATLSRHSKSSGLERVIEVVDVDTTLTELRQIKAETGGKVSEVGERADWAVNVSGNQVHIYTLDASALKGALEEAGYTLSTKAVVKEVDALVTPAHGVEIHGGEDLRICMSGFSVEHDNGDKGILTAAYCDPNDNARGSTDLHHEEEREGGSYDVEWHTVENNPHVAVKNKVYDGSHHRSVASGRAAGTHYVGAYVCKYGVATGYGCGNIIENDYGWVRSSDGMVFDPTWIRVRNSSCKGRRENVPRGRLDRRFWAVENCTAWCFP